MRTSRRIRKAPTPAAGAAAHRSGAFTLFLVARAEQRFAGLQRLAPLHDRFQPAQVRAIDYPNFKATVRDAGRLHAYHDVWDVMARYQEVKHPRDR